MSTIKLIPLTSIVNAKSGEGNYRKFSKDSEEFKALVKSVKAHGIQTPITVAPIPGKRGKDTYQVVSGFRRSAAALAAGLTEIPASVTDMAPSMAGLLGNQLEEVHPYYTTAAVTAEVNRLVRDGATKDQAYQKVADSLGKSKSYINNLALCGAGLSGKVMARWAVEADPAFTGPKFVQGTDGANKIRLMTADEQDAKLAEWLGAKGDKATSDGGAGGAGAAEGSSGGVKRPGAGLLDKATAALEILRKNAENLGHDTSYLDGALSALAFARGEEPAIDGPNGSPIFTPPVKKERKPGKGKKGEADATDDGDDAE